MEAAHESALTPEAFARLHAAVAAESQAALQVQPNATKQQALNPRTPAHPRVLASGACDAINKPIPTLVRRQHHD